MSQPGEQATRVNGSGSVTIPKWVREELNIEEGDSIRWTVDEDGELSVEIVRERYGAFEDFEPGTGKEETNSVEDLDKRAE
jgi:antitoxin PrlF